MSDQGRVHVLLWYILVSCIAVLPVLISMQASGMQWYGGDGPHLAMVTIGYGAMVNRLDPC